MFARFEVRSQAWWNVYGSTDETSLRSLEVILMFAGKVIKRLEHDGDNRS